MAKIDYFEIPADDVEKAKSFYEDLFGWKIQQSPDPNYWIISTGHEEKPEDVSGGMQKRQMPGQQITIMIGVEDVDATLEKAKGLGAEIIKPKTEWGMVHFAVIKDTQDNVFGIFEQIKRD
jgi:predicted enzyme related to lactoylglutathione lyase